MKEYIQRAIDITEKTIVVVAIILALGLINDGNLSLMIFRKVLLFGALLGLVIGLTLPIFDLEKFDIKIAYLIHLVIGFSALNILEGVVFTGTFLPTSPPINYLYKLGVFVIAYALVTVVSIFNEKRKVEKMSERIDEIKKTTI